VIVGTVYDPSDGSGEASRVGLPERPDVVDVLAELNAGLRAGAETSGARIAASRSWSSVQRSAAPRLRRRRMRCVHGLGRGRRSAC
jgi:hypothetical protein